MADGRKKRRNGRREGGDEREEKEEDGRKIEFSEQTKLPDPKDC